MRMRIAIPVFTVLLAGALPAAANSGFPERGKDPQAFVRKGWKMIKETKGLLQAGGPECHVSVHERIDKPSSDEAPPRVLYVLLRQRDGSWKLDLASGIAVLRADEGGMLGDPLQALKLDAGACTLSFWGGSRNRWAYTFRFLCTAKSWSLVTASVYTGDALTGEEMTIDYDLVAGRVLRVANNRVGDKLEKTEWRGIRDKKPLLDLRTFNVRTVIEGIGAGKPPF